MKTTIRTALAAIALAALSAAAHAAPALWEVSDADSKVWLLGSIHVLPPGVEWRTSQFNDVLDKAAQVYFEADIGPLGQLGVVIKSIRMAFSGHESWLTQLTPAQMAKLGAAITPLGLTPDQLGAYEPWLAEAVIEDRVMKTLGFDASLGVDASLQAELPSERKAYFETAGGQMDMLADAPEDQQISRLMATVDQIGELPAQLKDLATAWSTGDTTALSTDLADDPTMDEAFTQTMVFNRNAKWVTTIEGMLSGNQADLIVVGAGHLVGDGSVLELLSKAGFTVTRIQ
jgi:uncharacterized protein YbaP (TraB family)